MQTGEWTPKDGMDTAPVLGDLAGDGSGHGADGKEVVGTMSVNPETGEWKLDHQDGFTIHRTLQDGIIDVEVHIRADEGMTAKDLSMKLNRIPHKLEQFEQGARDRIAQIRSQ